MDLKNNDNSDYKLNLIASQVIREKRIEKGYSLEKVANKLNNIITRQSLYRYENNKTIMKNNILNNQDEYQPTFYNKVQIENLPVKIIGIAKEERTRL